MPHVLPRLRLGLDFMPSPDPERPGLLIRDPYHFSDAMLLFPPALVPLLACFDGEQTTLDLRSNLVRVTGEIQVSELEKQIYDTLSGAGFLEDEAFEELRHNRMREFAESPRREPTHAGSAYPEDGTEAKTQLDEYMRERPSYPEDSLLGIAAPHVSPFGGWESYRDAYAALKNGDKDKTFVILGTSHYGEPDRFGLTRKPFLTPFGESQPDLELVNELATKAPGAVNMEDYCHSVEHSIEFQVLFLQYVFGPDIKILPVLCGSFARSIYRGGLPEENEHVKRFFGTLGEIATRDKHRLHWVLGIDMAHMGRRYGDSISATADAGEMLNVADRDRGRIGRISEFDGRGFWDLVQQNQDDLKWCGSAPLYTFLSCVPKVQGRLRRYQQWNIDEQSVVSFAAMTFHEVA
jgi:AmmeMemoRadiSam system protein B